MHDVQLNVIRRGSGSPIVFLHGLGMSGATWDAVTERLADRHTVLAVDLPGHGRSAGEALTSIEDMADWLADFVTTAGLKPAHLVGHSMGGVVILHYLVHLHDPADPTLPPIDHVVTLNSPHTGADLAGAAQSVLRRRNSSALTGTVAALGGPNGEGQALADLAPGSDLLVDQQQAWRDAAGDRFAGAN